jgi:hypothetical protein
MTWSWVCASANKASESLEAGRNFGFGAATTCGLGIDIDIDIDNPPSIGTAIIDRTPSAPLVPRSFHCTVSSDSPR